MIYREQSDFKQQKCVVSQSWKPEIWSQGVDRATHPLVAPREKSSLPLLASGVCQTSLALLGLSMRPSSCVAVLSQCRHFILPLWESVSVS